MKLLPKGYGVPLTFCIQSTMPSLSVTTMPDSRSMPSDFSWAVMYLVGGFVLGTARVLGTAGPFGIAIIAAAGAGVNGVCCLFGAALGYIVSGGLSWGIRYLAAVVIVFTVEFSFQDTKLYKKTLFAPTTAAAVTLATGTQAETPACRSG